MDYATAIILFLIFTPALFRKVNVYESLISGTKDGLDVVVRILPSMICIMSAAAMLRASGAMDWMTNFISPITDFLKIPSGIVPMALMRPVSGSASMGLLADNLKTFGADSTEGLISSIIMGSTETTFYTIAIYFAGVKNTKIPMVSGLIGDLTAVVIATFIVKNFIFA